MSSKPPSADPKKKAASKKKSKKKDGGSSVGPDGSPLKKVPKIKKTVLAEQERLVGEASLAAAAERERQEVEAKKRAEVAEKAATEARLAAEDEALRLHGQRESDAEFLAERARLQALLEAQVYERTSWDKYLECNPLPDVSRESALNTYLSMWRDSAVSSEDESVNAPLARYRQMIDGCSTTERVVDLMEESQAEAREEMQLAKSAWCQSFILLLRALSLAKLDALTAQFLARYDEYENHETRVMNVAHNTPDIAFGLWVHNTAKRADGASVRVKRIEFPSIGFNLELPAALQKSRTSIRVLRTLFDHTAIPSQTNNLGGVSGGSGGGGLSAKMARASISAGSNGNGNGNGNGSNLSSAQDSLFASMEPSEMPPVEKDVAEISRQADELYAASLAAHAEQASLTAALGPSHPPVNFVSVGGIISIEQLALPPPPKKAKGWVMRDITALNKSIQVVPYPAASDADAAASAANQSPAAAAAAAAAGAAALAAGGASQAPMRVSFMLPAYVFLDDREPHFGWWDARHQCWRQEGVSLTRYEPRAEGGLVHLSLTLLKPVAIIQPRALDFPYRAWHLRPLHSVASAMAANEDGGEAGDAGAPVNPAAENQSLAHMYELVLQGSRFHVELELGADHARLTHPISPVLAELNSQRMLPGILLNRMQRAGINVQPSIEDAAYCRKPLKSLLLTAALHEHLALVGGVFELSGSPFNSSRSARKCLFRVRLARGSILLANAVSKRARLDAEARARALAAEEAARKKLEADGGAAALAAQAALAKKEADMAALIAAMEADQVPTGDKAASDAQREQAARDAEAEAEVARLAAEAEGPSGEQLAAAHAQRMALADEWVTVMVELAHVDAPPPRKAKVQVQLFSQDRTASAAGSTSASAAGSIAPSPAGTRPATARGANPDLEGAAAVEEVLPEGTVAESTPGGAELLKFTLIRGADPEGVLDERPLADCVSHFSLRRCLLAYFLHLTEGDLATALDMQLERRPPLLPSLRFLPEKKETLLSPRDRELTSPRADTARQVAAATGGGSETARAAAESSAAENAAAALAAAQAAAEALLPRPTFLQADLATLQIQQTIRRVLNLTNVFTFH